MPASLSSTLSIGRSEPLSLPGLAWPVELRPHPRARAMRLRLDEARERLTLTYPRRMSRRAALDWALRQGEWVEAQLADLQPGEPFQAGASIPFEGSTVRLRWDERLPRTPSYSQGELICGGPEAAFTSRIERYLRAQARVRLSAETAEAARRAGVSVRSVAIWKRFLFT